MALDKLTFAFNDAETAVTLRYDDVRAAPPLGVEEVVFPGDRGEALKLLTKWLLLKASAPYVTRRDLAAFLAYDEGALQRALAAIDARDAVAVPPAVALRQAASPSSGSTQAPVAAAAAAAGSSTAADVLAAEPGGSTHSAAEAAATAPSASSASAAASAYLPASRPPPVLSSWQLGAALARGAIVPARCITRLVAVSAAAAGSGHRHFMTTVPEDAPGREDTCVICGVAGAGVHGQAPADACASADSACFVGCEFCLASAHSGCAGLVGAARTSEPPEPGAGGERGSSSASSSAVAADAPPRWRRRRRQQDGAAADAAATAATADVSTSLRRWYPGDWYACPACMVWWLQEEKLPFPLAPLWGEERRIAAAVAAEDGRPARAAGRPILVKEDRQRHGHHHGAAATKGGGKPTYTVSRRAAGVAVAARTVGLARCGVGWCTFDPDTHTPRRPQAAGYGARPARRRRRLDGHHAGAWCD
jgi:hypothetical protein